MPHKLKCRTCSTPFEAKRRDARFCSRRCRDRARRGGSRRPASSRLFAAAVTAQLAELPVGLRSSGLALLAQAVADRTDEAATRDTAALARLLRALLGELRALAVEHQPREVDAIDALLARRRLRAGADPDLLAD